MQIKTYKSPKMCTLDIWSTQNVIYCEYYDQTNIENPQIGSHFGFMQIRHRSTTRIFADF